MIPVFMVAMIFFEENYQREQIDNQVRATSQDGGCVAEDLKDPLVS